MSISDAVIRYGYNVRYISSLYATFRTVLTVADTFCFCVLSPAPAPRAILDLSLLSDEGKSISVYPRTYVKHYARVR